MFWQPTNNLQPMHVLLTQGKDGCCRVAQLWLVGQLEYMTLEIKKTNYWKVRLYITNFDRIKLKIGLKTTRVLEDTWLTSCIKPVILLSANPKFVFSKTDLISDNNNKTRVLSVHEDNTFSFLYNIKKIDLGKFPDPGVYDVSNFWLKTKVAIEL